MRVAQPTVMPKRFAGRVGQSDVAYRIVIRGELGEPLVGPLEGMSVEAGAVLAIIE